MPLDSDLVQLNAKMVAYMSKTEARDKLCRAVAYGSDVVKWLLSNSGKAALEAWAPKVVKVKSGVGVARKCFRFGVTLREIDAMINTQEVGIPRTMKLCMHASNGMYYFLDMIELLSIFELLPYKTDKAIKKAREAAQKDGAQPDAKRWASLLASRRKLQAQLMVEMTNVPVALFNVTDWGRDAIGPVGAGMAGFVGSCIGGERRSRLEDEDEDEDEDEEKGKEEVAVVEDALGTREHVQGGKGRRRRQRMEEWSGVVKERG
ncbi:hypothetical protein GUITHDRAFT_163884 [Guillardia theta CCMP2712]|uniref:Uncharacterized protein n=1 Tax=Guillardia theta (strain CCMP2712) TaxID=905079 RepID=L1J401_GUITC|nr:hypothetical protein GUITHDRAFT_163884 [Guillardia theta CCMP2712]EKX43253.1 hypothetical protein GUITHDRAFT_163884 [Guillardia theta CCMP2712]|eukprot:XP_005830233.1 hypothetical protein GUITHDRAFT_163884 [Guillardia theta CCMP2712]